MPCPFPTEALHLSGCRSRWIFAHFALHLYHGTWRARPLRLSSRGFRIWHIFPLVVQRAVPAEQCVHSMAMITDWWMTCGGPNILGSGSESGEKRREGRTHSPHVRERDGLSISQVPTVYAEAVGSEDTQPPPGRLARPDFLCSNDDPTAWIRTESSAHSPVVSHHMAKAVNNGRRVARTRRRCAQSCGVLHMQCSPSLSFLVHRPCRCDALADCVTEVLLWTVLCRLTVVSRHRLARLSSPAGDVPIHPKPSPDGSVGVEGGQLSETWGFGDDGTLLCRAGFPSRLCRVAISCRMEDQATLAQGVGGRRSCREKRVRRCALLGGWG